MEKSFTRKWIDRNYFGVGPKSLFERERERETDIGQSNGIIFFCEIEKEKKKTSDYYN